MTSWDKRASRVSGLYDEVIERVIDSMKADVAEDGLDPSVLVELKRVRAYAVAIISAPLPACSRSRPFPTCVHSVGTKS